MPGVCSSMQLRLLLHCSCWRCCNNIHTPHWKNYMCSSSGGYPWHYIYSNLHNPESGSHFIRTLMLRQNDQIFADEIYFLDQNMAPIRREDIIEINGGLAYRRIYGPLTRYEKKNRVAHAPGCRERFPRRERQRKPLVSNPEIHLGTCRDGCRDS